MRRTLAVQGLAFCLFAAGMMYLVVSSADSWADWMVFGVLLVTALGAAIAVHERRWITRGRPISRSSERR